MNQAESCLCSAVKDGHELGHSCPKGGGVLGGVAWCLVGVGVPGSWRNRSTVLSAGQKLADGQKKSFEEATEQP